MPVRFTTPSLGGQREAFFEAGDWQVGVSYRHLWADTWFVGTDANEAAAPGGRPLYLNFNSLDLSVTYGLTDRLALTLTVPFSQGTHSRFYSDTARHRVQAGGLGDVSVVGATWLWDPATHLKGNVSLGLGVKAPTGNNEATANNYFANDSVGRQFVDQSIQLGDGGWGIVLQALAYRALAPRTSAYFVGWYLMSLKEHTDVPAPASPLLAGVKLAVPDVYSARGGLAFDVLPTARVSVSLGLRIDGIPMGDIVGGEDKSFRRPGYTLYGEPGITYRRGGDELTLSMPRRLHQNFKRSVIDRERNFAGGGDLADYLIFFGYNRRF